ncbi:hypothetical protein C8J57DRAFT_1509142 [Mycena rebaudengoi]|nr:hypothetical protein C8J57DRAFT_1509142 [Mycena rebaudengoi]
MKHRARDPIKHGDLASCHRSHLLREPLIESSAAGQLPTPTHACTSGPNSAAPRLNRGRRARDHGRIAASTAQSQASGSATAAQSRRHHDKAEKTAVAFRDDAQSRGDFCKVLSH